MPSELQDIGECTEELGIENVANELINNPITREIWLASMAKELGRLTQEWGTTKGTNTIEFMSHG